jgi:hypothetical protein
MAHEQRSSKSQRNCVMQAILARPALLRLMASIGVGRHQCVSVHLRGDERTFWHIMSLLARMVWELRARDLVRS